MAALVVSGAAAPSAARAHGPSLSIDDVLTWVDDTSVAGGVRPNLVRLLRGVARFEPDGLHYICPARWGGTEAPPMVAAGDVVYVAGVQRVVTIDAAGAVATLPPADGQLGLTMRTLVSEDVRSRDARVVGLTNKGELVQLAPGVPRVLASYDPSPDAVVWADEAGGGALVIATEDGGFVELARVHSDAAGGPNSLWVRDPPLYRGPYRAAPTLVRAAGDARVWLRGDNAEGQRLERVDVDPGWTRAALVPVATSGETILGPVVYDGATWLTVGGQPRRLDGDAPVVLPETTRLFCLRAEPTLGLFVCLTSDLHHYDAASGVGDPYLTLAMLRPPSLDGLDATAELGCRADWMDAAADAALPPELQRPPAWFPDEIEPGPEATEAGPEASEPSDTSDTDSIVQPESSPPEPAASSNCASGSTSTFGSLALASLALVGLARARTSQQLLRYPSK